MEAETVSFDPGSAGGNFLHHSWKVLFLVKQGQSVEAGQSLVRLRRAADDGSEAASQVLEAPLAGEVHFSIADGAEIAGPTKICEVRYCKHPVLMGALCAICGATVGAEGESSETAADERAAAADAASARAEARARVVVQGGSTLSLSRSAAESFHEAKAGRLLREKKLALVLDLDSTLVHATDDQRAAEHVAPDVHSFHIPGTRGLHFLKLRRGLLSFLQQASELYEMTIYTAGTRGYAEKVAACMDPTGRLFQSRIVSATDTRDLGVNNKSLARIFPGGVSMALIMDDREDVWRGEQARHLVLVKPYLFWPPSHREVHHAPGTVFGVLPNRAPPPVSAPAAIANGGTTAGVASAPTAAAAVPAAAAPAEAAAALPGVGKAAVVAAPAAVATPVAMAPATATAAAPAALAVSADAERSTASPGAVAAKTLSEAMGDAAAEASPFPPGGAAEKKGKSAAKVQAGAEKEGSGAAAATGSDQTGAATAAPGEVATNGAAAMEVEIPLPAEKAAEEKDAQTGGEASSVAAGSPSTAGGSSSAEPLVAAAGGTVAATAGDGNGSAASAPPVVIDDDPQLECCLSLLRRVHERYYRAAEPGEAAGPRDAGKVLQELRGSILSGVVLVLSGVVPLRDGDPRRHALWRHATMLGAEVRSEVGPGVTHVVASRIGTEKTTAGQRMPGVFVVHVDWLMHSIWHLRREDERIFLLAEPRPAEPRPEGGEKPRQASKRPRADLESGSRSEENEAAALKLGLIAAINGARSGHTAETAASANGSADSDELDDFARELDEL